MMKTLQQDYDYLAPDGSEIRLLAGINKAGLCHCSLPVGKTSIAVKHKTVIELWYFLEGEGELWKKTGELEDIIKVHAGVSLVLESGVSFQFRNLGQIPLKFVIATVPNWPGHDEAEIVFGKF